MRKVFDALQVAGTAILLVAGIVTVVLLMNGQTTPATNTAHFAAAGFLSAVAGCGKNIIKK